MLKHLLARSQFANSVIVLFVLGFSISLAASSVSVLLGERAWLALSISVVGLLLGLCYLLAGPASTRRQVRRFSAILALNNSGRIVKIPRYGFSCEMARYVSAVNSENIALLRQWGDGKLFDYNAFSQKDKSFSKTQAGNIAFDAINYFLIETLSTILTDYFNASEYQNSKSIKEITRKEIPNFLLENKILDTLSRPMEDRPPFLKHGKEGDISTAAGTIVSAYNADGSYFSRFDLTIPSDAKIVQDEHGFIAIESKRFRLSLRPSLSGYAGVLPDSFLDLYLNLDLMGLKVYKVDVEIETLFNLLHLFGRQSRALHGWVDLYMDKLRAELDFEVFIKNIHWEAALTIAKITQSKPEGKGRANEKLPPDH